jgi:hypothetical protein
VNGDGRDDVVVGTLSSVAGLGPVAAVFDAASKGLIAGFPAFPGQPFGVRLTSKDRDGDGRDEIVTTFTDGTPVVKIYTFDPASNTFPLVTTLLPPVPTGTPNKGLNVG